MIKKVNLRSVNKNIYQENKKCYNIDGVLFTSDITVVQQNTSILNRKFSRKAVYKIFRFLSVCNFNKFFIFVCFLYTRFKSDFVTLQEVILLFFYYWICIINL